jgi:hypothetical protein
MTAHKKERPSAELETLNARLQSIDKKLTLQLSVKRNILMSMLNGAGYAIGASIIARIIITILTWTIQSVHDVPILNKIMLPQNATQSR